MNNVGGLRWHTHHTLNTQACRSISGGLTFGLSPSMFSCISCATVCSRILFSSACCRRSFISSRVSSSGCKGGRKGGTYSHNETGTHRKGSGRGKERTHQDRRFRGIRLPIGEQLLYLGIVLSCSSGPWDYPRCYRCQQHAIPHVHSRQKNSLAFITESSSHFTSSMRT